MAIITCQGASFGYEGNTAVSGLDFEVQSGDYLCVVGENGSDKSTLIKGLLRLKAPLAGSVLMGEGLKSAEIGYLPQQTAAQKDFPASAYEVVLSGRLGGRGLLPFYSRKDKSEALGNMERLGISSLRNRCYRELSGGQQQRVLLARALCATKKVLLLDEPAAGLLVSLCAALLGVSLVLKRYAMIGDGLSHVGFGTLAIATAMNAAPLTVSIPVVVLAAFLLLRISERGKIKGDAAIALISTSSLAIGVVVISLTTGMNTDVCNYMFGSILAMSKDDVALSVALAAVVLTLFALFCNKIFAVTFDESFSKATGVKTGLYNMLIAFLTAITIVLGMRMMGALLISSLIIFPALTSMRLCKRFRSVTICSAAVSVACFFMGVVISYVRATPTGASVVIVNIAAFLVFWAANAIKGRIFK